MVNPFALTFDALYLTFTGKVPLEAWFPLIEDIFNNAVAMLSNILEVLI